MGCAGRYTLGYHMAYDGWLGLPDVPVEEATFFVVTNMMCLQVLMKYHEIMHMCAYLSYGILSHNTMCLQGVHLFLDTLVHLQ